MSTHRPTRRDFLLMGTGLFAVSTLGITAGRRRVVRRSVPVMGTIADIAVVTRDERRAQHAIDAALRELYQVEATMSRFSARSDIGRANLAAFAAPVTVDSATAHVIRNALRWAAAPGGAFDPALGRLAELWSVRGRTTPPELGSVQRLAARGLHSAVEVDGDRVRYHDNDVALDLGGIAKGFAVDRAVAALRDWGIRDGLVNAGGDLYALGAASDGEPWQVGIRSPHDPAVFATTHALCDRAVATSGDYEQYFDHAGRRYHHLLDPRTAAPRVAGMHSVSVAADSCMNADAGATAVFGLSQYAAQRVLTHIDRSAGVVHLL